MRVSGGAWRVDEAAGVGSEEVEVRFELALALVGCAVVGVVAIDTVDGWVGGDANAEIKRWVDVVQDGNRGATGFGGGRLEFAVQVVEGVHGVVAARPFALDGAEQCSVDLGSRLPNVAVRELDELLVAHDYGAYLVV